MFSCSVCPLISHSKMLMLCFTNTIFIIIYYYSLKIFRNLDVSKAYSSSSSSGGQINLYSFTNACLPHGCARWLFLGWFNTCSLLGSSLKLDFIKTTIQCFPTSPTIIFINWALTMFRTLFVILVSYLILPRTLWGIGTNIILILDIRKLWYREVK